MANLNEILNAIGVTGDEPAHHRTNLISAIEAFAILNKNNKLESECEAYREQVRTAIEL